MCRRERESADNLGAQLYLHLTESNYTLVSQKANRGVNSPSADWLSMCGIVC